VEGKEAQKLIDLLDDVVNSPQVDPDLSRKCLRALRKICGLTGMLPRSHMLTDGLTKSNDVPMTSGGFADVWDGHYGDTRVAIKALRVYRTDDQEMLRKMFCKEVIVWKRLSQSHANILPLLGVSTTVFPFCMVSPWMKNGNLSEYVRSNPGTGRVKLLVDVAKGLSYLHSLHILHGDLKGANVLVNDSGQACLADFGLTSILSNINTLNASTLLSRPKGTVRWMAPETLDPEMFDADTLPNRGFSTASDVYAFAMVVMEIFTGNAPFEDFRNEPSVIVKVMQGGRPVRPERSHALGLSDQLWELVQMCWRQDRNQRPTISSVLDTLEAILDNDPQISMPPVESHSPYRYPIGDSSSSVSLPSQPLEVSSVVATTRRDAASGDVSYSNDPDTSHTEKNSVLPSAGFKSRIRGVRYRLRCNKSLKKILHAVFPCIHF